MLIEERQRATNHNTRSCTFKQNEIGETVTATAFVLIKAMQKERDSGWEVGELGEVGGGGAVSQKTGNTENLTVKYRY